MILLTFFVDAARRRDGASRIVALAALAGVASGVGATWILSIVHRAIRGEARTDVAATAAFVTLCVITVALRAASQVLLARFAIQIAEDLRRRLCQRIVAAPLPRLESIGLPRLLGAFTEDTPAITNGMAQVPTLCVSAVIVAGGLGYIAWLSWFEALLLLLVALPGLALYRGAQRRAQARFRVAHASYLTLLGHFRALVQGSKELQLNAARRQEFMHTAVDASVGAVGADRFRAQLWFAVADSWVAGVVWLIVGLLMIVPALAAATDGAGATGAVVVFLYVIQPVQAMLATASPLTQAGVAVGKVRALEKTLAEATAPSTAGPTAVSATWRSIELRGVRHAYGDGPASFVVGPIDLTVRQGEILFIAGGNGSGKTTLIKMLTGLYWPSAGEIRVDGAAIDPSRLEWYRGHFAAVFTDFHLFDRLYGLPVSDTAGRDALARLRLHEKVQITDGAFSTTQLSQGQRKRLALVTAYLEDRPIYVLDEWAADQDSGAREFFYREFLPELKRRGKACVVVSHDERYYACADRIVKLDFGRLETEQREEAFAPLTA